MSITHQPRFRLLSAFAVATLLAVVLAGCSSEPSSAPTGTPSPNPTSTAALTLPDTTNAAPTPSPTPADAPTPTPAASGSAETDREALAALYNATDGENWDRSDNWLSDAPLGEWEGVTTNDDGRVTELSLSFNDLSGEIPAELGSLSNLRTLDVGFNALRGCVPRILRDQLDMGFSDRGGLPFCGVAAEPAASGSAETDREALAALYNATDGENWDRSDNWLSDAPLGEWEGVTTNDDGRVTELSLSFNDLSGEIPAELGNLSNLTYLGLSGEIPAELGSLSDLEGLLLYSNELSGEIPAELGSLSYLTELYLFENELSGEIPAELGSLSNLEMLWLDNNELSGEIPAELGSLSNLIWLRLSANCLSGCVPSSLEDQLSVFGASDLGGLPYC